MNDSRERLVETTRDLLEQQGYYATGLNQIVETSGSPKGSLYYYFPDGKEELTVEAIRRAGKIVLARIQSSLATVDEPGEAIRQFVLAIAGHVEAAEYRVGGPITAVAMETAATSPRLNEACREVFRLWHGAFEEKISQTVHPPERASQIASIVLAGIEGATVLSRTYHSPEPLERVAKELGLLLQGFDEQRQ
ncbi:MAG TPA: TetR/AcrR family transcriptional regulator [Chloroflexota bacterium]|nr:TetR/AcrR family transcriptional regulator [Chloroflexota bacterium]